MFGPHRALDGTDAAHVPAMLLQVLQALCAVEALLHSSRLCVRCLAFWAVETVTVFDVSKYSIICPWHHDAFGVMVSDKDLLTVSLLWIWDPSGRPCPTVSSSHKNRSANLTRASRGSSARYHYPKSEQSPVSIGLQVGLLVKYSGHPPHSVTHCGPVELGRTYTSLTSKFTMLPRVPGLIKIHVYFDEQGVTLDGKSWPRFHE